MIGIVVKEITTELIKDGVIEETEDLSRAAADDLAKKAVERLIPHDPLSRTVQLAEIKAQLDMNAGVDIGNPAAGTVLRLRPYDPNYYNEENPQ